MADKKSIFNEDNIRLNASFATKEEAIRAAGQILADNGYVKEEYIDDMLKREEVVSTYIGNHIAIPHGIVKSEERIMASGISFFPVPEGVDYEGKTANVIIGIAGKNNEHIEILGDIAVACSDLDNVEKLRNAKTKEDEELTNKIEIIKYIVNKKLAEKEARENEKKNKEKRQRILEIKAKRQDEALENMSDEDLDKMLADLN